MLKMQSLHRRMPIHLNSKERSKGVITNQQSPIFWSNQLLFSVLPPSTRADLLDFPRNAQIVQSVRLCRLERGRYRKKILMPNGTETDPFFFQYNNWLHQVPTAWRGEASRAHRDGNRSHPSVSSACNHSRKNEFCNAPMILLQTAVDELEVEGLLEYLNVRV